MDTKRLWLSVVAAVMLASCASQGDAVPGREFQRLRASDLPIGESACFYSGSVNNFRVVDERNVIVYGSPKKQPYLVELATMCPDLRNATTIGFLQSGIGQRVCGYAREFVVVPGLSRSERCRITAVRELDKEKLVELLAAHGKR